MMNPFFDHTQIDNFEKVYLGQEVKIHGTDLYIKLLDFDEDIGGNSDEYLDRYFFKALVRCKGREYEFNRGWTTLTPDEKRYQELAGYCIWFRYSCVDPFQRSNDPHPWIRFMAWKIDEDEKKGKTKSEAE